jgi:DNA-binding IclR family transcriptional regulator
MNEPKRIQSLMRALDLLEVLSSGPKNLTELSNLAQLHVATTFQLISTLELRGYISKDPKTKKYCLGLKIAELNESLWKDNSFKLIAKPYLRQLGEITGETAHLAAYNNNKILLLDVELSTGFLIVNSEIGENAPAHSSAVGKAILSFLPKEVVDTILKGRLKKYTKKTITSKRKLQKQLEEIRKLGYAMDEEETFIGVRCIASPVFKKNEVIQGAVGISGAAVRFKSSKISELSQQTKKIATQISRELGYKPKSS